MTVIEKSKRKPFIRLFTGILFAGGIAMLVFTCTSGRSVETVKIGYKTKDKTYLFSNMGGTVVKENIQRKTSPAAIPFFNIYNEDGIWAQPQSIKELCDMMWGNFEIWPYKEKSYDGYITTGFEEIYTIKSAFESTEKIGEQLVVSTVKIKNISGKTKEIKWSRNMKTGELNAIKNCEVRSFNIETKPSPGETVISSEDFVVVNLDELATFFGGIKLEFDEDDMLLYIIEK